MKRIVLSLLLLPTFLMGCSTSNWYSVDIVKANEIAQNIVLYNKQNIPPHIMSNFEACSTYYRDEHYIRFEKGYSAYNLDQYCHETSRIMFDERYNDVEMLFTTRQVANNMIIDSTLQVTYDSYMGVRYTTNENVYYAKDNQAAKKMFKQMIVETFNPYSALDSLINDPNYHHENGIRTKNPLEDGSCEILAKNNNSLDIKSEWRMVENQGSTYIGEKYNGTMYVENNRCLKNKSRSIMMSNRGEIEIHYELSTYDYDTPVHFDI